METTSGQKIYEEYVKQVTPTASLPARMLKAFLIGGLICLIGQVITNFLMNWADLPKKDATAYCTLLLVLTSVVLTGFGVYRKIVSFAGAGALVPITGFANSVASAAIEYKFEGQVFGIGCKIFTIAGPVILYGVLVSWILGLIYWLMGLLGM